MRIAVLSDTHNQLRREVMEVVEGCDVVFHGGDICRQEILDKLSLGRSIYAVRGNNDKAWAGHLAAKQQFTLDGVNFIMTHDKKDLPWNLEGIDVVIFGHSHKYLQEIRDGRLWLNPGSCGRRRFCQEITMAVITVEDGNYQIEKVVFPQE